MGVKTLLLLLVALEVRLAAGGQNGRSMPGSPTNISRDDRGLQQVVLATAYSFNNQSNDAFLFKPSTVHRAQRQVVKGVRYIVDLDVSRTICRKRDHNDHDLSKCDFQPEGRLQQTFRCHSDVWSIPWTHEMKILDFVCKSMKPAEDPGSDAST
ncbi:putative cystatin-F isoform 2 [Scophthalmus maximus]|uniref:Cystatin F n=1 Tax=Scophthalmus maximus TaxID=52904 RepID=A0A2U9CE06_SCOMX|nr:cystatin-F [Scophthalmus maximus]AWP14726.1 putative cystatin-F [Scophthalmus maximus]AWP14727.1 putative cystatin-F isoform 2 [Scophthalmus maximus]